MIAPLLGSIPQGAISELLLVAAGLAVLVVFVLASRVIAHLLAQQLRNRHVPPGMIVLGRRVVYVVVIGFGILGAFTIAFQTANVTLVGILLATVVAALGVQELLQDYVSGYYVLVERHFRVGDRIGFDDKVGTVGEVKLRVTLLRTDEGHLVVVPNSELFTKAVTVYARPAVEPAPKEPVVQPESRSEPPA